MLKKIFHKLSIIIYFFSFSIFPVNEDVSDSNNSFNHKNLYEIAEKEIGSPDRLKNGSPVKGLATIKVVIPEKKDLISQSAYEIGFALSLYKPSGTYSLTGYNNFKYETLPYKLLPRIKVNFFPLFLSLSKMSYKVGPFFDFSVTCHGVELETLTGSKVNDTNLYTIMTSIGLSNEISILRNKEIFFGLNLGLSSLVFFQSSSLSSASFTQEKTVFLTSPYLKYSFSKDFKFFASYESRYIFNKRENEINDQKHNILIGLIGVLD